MRNKIGVIALVTLSVIGSGLWWRQTHPSRLAPPDKEWIRITHNPLKWFGITDPQFRQEDFDRLEYGMTLEECEKTLGAKGKLNTTPSKLPSNSRLYDWANVDKSGIQGVFIGNHLKIKCASNL